VYTRPRLRQITANGRKSLSKSTQPKVSSEATASDEANGNPHYKTPGNSLHHLTKASDSIRSSHLTTSSGIRLSTTMRIGCLLNDSPPDSPATDPGAHPTSNTGNLEHCSVQPAVAIKETLVNDTTPSSVPSPSDPLMGPNQPYLLFQQAYRERTASSRRSYSGPSANSLTGATSPLEISITQRSNNVPWFGRKPTIHDDIVPPPISGRTQQQQQPLSLPRVLPPFTTFVNMPQPTTMIVPIAEGATSPQSNHQHHSPQTDNGYFGVTSHATQYIRAKDHYQRQQLHTQSHVSYTSQDRPTSSAGNADPLMRFAAVAMESATLGGRQNLEEVAAAEVLTGQRGNMGSSIDGNSVQSEKRNASIHIE